MRIAFITSHINKSSQWKWFSEDLKNRGVFHLHIIINPVYPQLADDLKKLNVPCFFLTQKNIFTLALNLFKTIYILIRYRITIVHTELPYGNLIGQLAAFFCRIKLRITTTENTSWAFDFNNRKQLFIDRLTYKLGKRIIALTDISKEYIHQNFHQPTEKITTIWHTLKTSEYSVNDENKIQQLKKELNINSADFIVGMVARFEGWKGHSYVVEAISKLINKYPQIKLHIVGGKGESYDAVMSQIKKLNLEHAVFIHNFISDNITLYKTFDIHVHVPVNEMAETFGITVIEGMISGCPQILTKSGISIYTAADKKNCLVVDYCSSEQIANSIEWMLNNPEKKKELGLQAQADARAKFSYQNKTESHLKIYNQLLENKSK